MKKMFLVLICFIFCYSFVFAETSKEFSSIWSLLDALHFLDWGSSYELSESDEEIHQMLTKLMNQNAKYKDAANSMKEYINEKDEYISLVAKGISGGALGLISANNKIIDKLRKLDNDDPEGLKDIAYTIAETNVEKKKAWEAILLSAGWSLPVIIEYPSKTEEPTGKIPFKISAKDREILIKRIDKLFAEKLKRYKNFLELSQQGKETNPQDSTYIIAGVDKIREYLVTETYEEAEAREKGN